MSALVSGLARVLRQRRALLAFFACRAAAATLLALPISRALVVGGIGGHPRGDAPLFDDGGVILIEAVRASLDLLRAELRDAVWLAALFAWLLLLPFGGLVAALAEDVRVGMLRALRHSSELFTRFTLLGGIAWFSQGVLLTIAVVIAVAVNRRMGSGSERRADLVALAIVVGGALLAALSNVVLDLARVEVTLHGGGVLRAVRDALLRLVRGPVAYLGAALAMACAGLGVIALAGRLTGLLDVSRPGGWRVVLVLVVHQGAVLALTTLRAAWLGYAIERAPSAPTPASADRSEDSGAPGDPSPDPSA